MTKPKLTIQPVDRTDLTYLPEEKSCIQCSKTLPQKFFRLKFKNQFNKDAPQELREVCRDCEKMIAEMNRKYAATGKMISKIKNGERVFSDRFLELLTSNSNYYLDRILNNFAEQVSGGDSPDLFRMAFQLAQGSTPILHVRHEDPYAGSNVSATPNMATSNTSDGTEKLLQTLRDED